MHEQSELRIFRRFGGHEFEKARLRDHENVRKTRLQTSQTEGAEVAVGELQRGACNFGVRDLVKLVGQSDLIEDFHHGWMNSIAAKCAVEVLVHFEQCDGNAAACKEKGKDRAGRTAAHDAAGGLRGAADFPCGRRAALDGSWHVWRPGWARV